MKLYNKIPKRIAKKKIGRYWRKLNYARHLKPGDLVSTCEGVNRRVKEITPDWKWWKNQGWGRKFDGEFVYFKRGEFVIDFDIFTTTGGSCSAVHCCTFPTETREQIVDYWKNWYFPEQLDPLNIHSLYIFGKMCVEGDGNKLFTELGEPTELYEEIRERERKLWDERMGRS